MGRSWSSGLCHGISQLATSPRDPLHLHPQRQISSDTAAMCKSLGLGGAVPVWIHLNTSYMSIYVNICEYLDISCVCIYIYIYLYVYICVCIITTRTCMCKFKHTTYGDYQHESHSPKCPLGPCRSPANMTRRGRET